MLLSRLALTIAHVRAPPTPVCVRAGKEYAKADSRYVSSDPFTVTMESTTAFVEGPMCLAVAYAIASRSSWRFPLQIIVSVGQLYGCILYFAIVWFGDVRTVVLQVWAACEARRACCTRVPGHSWASLKARSDAVWPRV